MCKYDFTTYLQYFLMTDKPAAPLNVTVNQVERVSGGGSVTITASWIRPPNSELFDIERYDINVTSTSGIQQMAVTVNGGSTSTMFTVAENPSNVQPSTTFTITISAVNLCGDTGKAATESYTLSKFCCSVYGNFRIENVCIRFVACLTYGCRYSWLVNCYIVNIARID